MVSPFLISYMRLNWIQFWCAPPPFFSVRKSMDSSFFFFLPFFLYVVMMAWFLENRLLRGRFAAVTDLFFPGWGFLFSQREGDPLSFEALCKSLLEKSTACRTNALAEGERPCLGVLAYIRIPQGLCRLLPQYLLKHTRSLFSARFSMTPPLHTCTHTTSG
eukprot:RCo039497